MTTLTGPRKDATSGKADSLVIFLHGYGSDGNDLIGIGDSLAEHLPNTTFLAPNAPQRCANNPMGCQWSPIPWLDGTSEELARQGQVEAVAMLNTWLDEVAVTEGIGPERTIIFGFSQGTMMALHVGPRREMAFAGIVGFSGRLLEPGLLEAEMQSKPPILLVHGDSDDMVSPAVLPEAADALVKAGFEVYTHISKNTGHGIAPDGLNMALQFIKMKLDN
ncbi:MAG: prolyl oligopeptidase family serine peptidase [Paracoccaceae bacterium]|jgi:phospholipase/carboxylesterase